MLQRRRNRTRDREAFLIFKPRELMETRADILLEVLSLEREKKEILLKQKELYEKAKNISDTEDDKL